MKCPFCNFDLKDGQVFCEACGNEIHLVPLFEPEVEETMQTSIHGMVEGLDEEKHAVKETAFDTTEYTTNASKGVSSKSKVHRKLYLSILIVAVLIGVASPILWGISRLSKPMTFETYLQKAKDAYGLEKYDKTVVQLKNAFETGTSDEELLQEAYLLMVRSYISMADVEQAEKCLQAGVTALGQNEALYKLWIQLEEQLGNYDKLAQILSEVTSESLLKEYAGYICNAPYFDTDGGSYQEVIYLKLMQDGVGKIYYTINGGEPTTESEEYISPIKLENGNFEIKAVFVNQYGIMSDVVTVSYEIDIAVPDEPDISLESGTYYEPQLINIYLLDDTYSVYYTIDGSDPDLSAIKYEGGISLPFGKSHYRFVMYDEDGVASDIADREYAFYLDNVNIDTEQARIMLLQKLIVNGIVTDVEGHVAGAEEIHSYSCNTAFSVNGEVYYLFVETETDPLGNSIRTGSLYGVNVMSGAICRVRRSEDNYVAEDF